MEFPCQAGRNRYHFGIARIPIVRFPPVPRVLLIEDNTDIARLIALHVRDLGCEVDQAHTGEQGLALARGCRYDLVILDLMLPGMDGLAVCRHLRAGEGYVPILMLTAKSTELDRVLGLELGADDYLTKPFGLGELMARVKALLRRNRSETKTPAILRFLDIEVDFENYTILKNGVDVHFSQKEFKLLEFLIQRPNQAIDKRDILDAVWGYKSDASTRTIDTHVARIRRKLGDQDQNRILRTVPTVGYKFVAEIKS